MSTLRLTIELHTDDGAYEVFAASVPCPVPHPHPAAACSDLHRLAPVTRVAQGLTAVLEQLTAPKVHVATVDVGGAPVEMTVVTGVRLDDLLALPDDPPEEVNP